MKLKIILAIFLSLAGFARLASAHVLYKNLLVDNLDPSGAFWGYLYNNYGWVDGTDSAANDVYPLGNTHLVYWTRFSLSAESHVSLRVQARDSLPTGNPGAGGIEIPFRADLAPGFTLYSGLAPSLAHDGATPGCVQGGEVCHGIFDALNSFTLWNSRGQNATIEYLGHAQANSKHPRYAITSFKSLPIGNYSLVIGGGNPKGIPDGTGMPLGVRAFSVSIAIVPTENAPSAPSLSQQKQFSGILPQGQTEQRYRVRCRPLAGLKTGRYWFAISGLTANAPALELTVQKKGQSKSVTDLHNSDFAFSNWSSVGQGDGVYEWVVARVPSSQINALDEQAFKVNHACGTDDGLLTITGAPVAVQ